MRDCERVGGEEIEVRVDVSMDGVRLAFNVWSSLLGVVEHMDIQHLPQKINGM